ncbi:MAG: peptidoglycan-binding domain-containing protein [Actinomycetota bacterium]
MNTQPKIVNNLAELALKGPNLYPWDTGPFVAQLQQLLRAHGFELRVDGDFNSLTEMAVRAYQRQQGLRIDGIVDRKTWAALKTTVQPGTRILRRGDTGADVCQLQGLLQIYGYHVPRDGIFGAETQEAVLAFQRQHQLKVNGAVDAITWTVLLGSPPLPTPPKQTRWLAQNRKWW